jgi:hypothetical protein
MVTQLLTQVISALLNIKNDKQLFNKIFSYHPFLQTTK